ncbi:unnamed protein product, partial [Rhizoctonia solani]
LEPDTLAYHNTWQLESVLSPPYLRFTAAKSPLPSAPFMDKAVAIESCIIASPLQPAPNNIDTSQPQVMVAGENTVLDAWSRASGILGGVSGNRKHRASIETIHSNQTPGKKRYIFRKLFRMSLETEGGSQAGKEKSQCQDQGQGQARHCNVEMDRTQWKMTRLIGYTNGTNMEDWTVVLDIFSKVNESDSEAKEASKALRKDIQFGHPIAQLSAARLWPIMMRNCTYYFIAHTANRKFLGRIEEVILSPTTSPVVRDRLIEVIGGLVYLLKDSKHFKPYQSTWKKLRLQLKLNCPREGFEVPPDDIILNPAPHRRLSSIRCLLSNKLVQPDSVSNVVAVTQELTRAELGHEIMVVGGVSHTGSADGVISSEEVMQHLSEDCKIARDKCQILEDSLSCASDRDACFNNAGFKQTDNDKNERVAMLAIM